MDKPGIYTRFIALLALISLPISCGGSGGDLRGKYSVNDVNILADDITVGEGVRVEVFFETKFEATGAPDAVQVIVRLPSEIAFVTGSSFIYDNINNDTDTRAPDDVLFCAGGESFLIYNFEEFELLGKELGNIANYGFRIEARGVTPTPVTFVGAAAGEGAAFACGDVFEAEEDEGVEVL